MKQPAKPTFDGTLALIQGVMNRYLPDQPHTYYTGNGQAPERAIRWSFGIETPKSATSTSPGKWLLTIYARHGAFGESTKTTTRGWWSLEYVTEADVTNALFAALSWDGSPYEFDGKVWAKRMEVM